MRHVVAAICLAIVATSWAAPAAAHGPPPFVVGVAATDASGPTVLVVSEGLVQRRDDAWVYVFPSQFGNDPSPPALSVDGQRTCVSGADGLYALEADGSVEALGIPDLARGGVVQLVASRGEVYGVRSLDIQSEIRSVDGFAPLWTAFEPVQVAHGDDAGFWVGSIVGGTAALVHVDPSGAKDHVERMISTSSSEMIIYGAGTHMHYVGKNMTIHLAST